MLIVDDQLFLRALLRDRSWTNDGSLATTYGFQYRLAMASLKNKPVGVHSKKILEFPDADRRILQQRILQPEPEVRALDPRLSIGLASRLSVTLGRLNLFQAEIVGAALFYDAAIVVAVMPPPVEEACSKLGIELIHITS